MSKAVLDRQILQLAAWPRDGRWRDVPGSRGKVQRRWNQVLQRYEERKRR